MKSSEEYDGEAATESGGGKIEPPANLKGRLAVDKYPTEDINPDNGAVLTGQS